MFDDSNFDVHKYETYDNVRHEICSLTELLKTKSFNDIDSKLNKLCRINGTIMLIEEFSNDFKNGLCLTKKINQLIGYKYISINFLKNKLKHFRLEYSRIYNLKGQKFNAEGTAHYISYECMLNHNDGINGLSPLEYGNDIRKIY